MGMVKAIGRLGPCVWEERGAWLDLFFVYGRERRQVMVNIFLVYGIEIWTGLDIFLGLQGIEGMETLFLVYACEG